MKLKKMTVTYDSLEIGDIVLSSKNYNYYIIKDIRFTLLHNHKYYITLYYESDSGHFSTQKFYSDPTAKRFIFRWVK